MPVGRGEKAFDCGYGPTGVRRQLVAIIADGNRVARLRTIRAPTLMIHGEVDQLVPRAAGEDVERLVASARRMIVLGMAHRLPPSQNEAMVRMIAHHAVVAS